jgi:hypothetical protein
VGGVEHGCGGGQGGLVHAPVVAPRVHEHGRRAAQGGPAGAAKLLEGHGAARVGHLHRLVG